MVTHSRTKYRYLYNHIIQIYSEITSGGVLNGERFYIKILEVKLFAFAYRLFHEDFSPINGAPHSRIFVIYIIRFIAGTCGHPETY